VGLSKRLVKGRVIYPDHLFIELDDGKIYRKALYLMVKTRVSCRFSLKPIQIIYVVEYLDNPEVYI
jgi:hypothetical protein